MVVTRKRNCSASETTSSGTPRGAKTRKEDDEGGGDGGPVTTRTTASRCVAASETTVTTRRSRRFNESIGEAVTSSPKTLKVKQGSSNPEAPIPDKAPASESSYDSTAEDSDASVILQRKLIVKLKDIGTATPQSPRRRRVSGGEKEGGCGTAAAGTPTVGTPIRRSRRLSGSGVEASSDQETPSNKLSSVARVLEENPKEDTASKQSVLPVIEEDAEGSPIKDTRKVHLKGEEKLDSAAAKDDEADNEAKTGVDQPVAIDEGDARCDSQDVPSENIKEAPEKKSSEAEEPKIESMEVTKSNDGQESKTESTKLDNIQESKPTAPACKEINTSSTPTDENANSQKMNGVNTLSSIPVGEQKVSKVIPDMENKINQLRSVPKGLPISGRWWKKEKQRFRSINKDTTGKKKWSQKMHLKRQRGDVLAKSNEIKAEKQKKKEDLKERQRVNKIRREENAKKSEIVQVIKDPRKIKKMKRKQLRQLEKRDTSTIKTV